MKEIIQWQKELAAAANEKYPVNAQWSEEDRLMSIAQQLGDVYRARMEEKKLLLPDKQNQSINHRIAALLADILIYCEMRQVDIEPHLLSVLYFFQDKHAKRSSEA